MGADRDPRSWVLSQNRAEELGEDVWQYFVIPPYHDRLALSQSRKPRVIVGGRGCGKTMLLRYLSHHSRFSPHRQQIDDSEIDHVGLYWRMDTQFSKSMRGRGLEPDVWSAAFHHFCAITLGMQVLQSLDSIAHSACPAIDPPDVANIDFARIKAFDSSLPAASRALHDYLEEALWKFVTWVNDVRRVEQPLFLPGEKFVSALISTIKRSVAAAQRITFFVYVDEYENLNAYQQRIINTWIKHSMPPLVFNVAMKRNSFVNRETEGNEHLSPIHDYREFDLEETADEFKAFAAEVLFLQMANAGISAPVDPDALRDPARLDFRKSPGYRSEVIAHATRLLPGRTEIQLAEDVISDGVLMRQLRSRIAERLKAAGSDAPAEAFVRKDFARASIIVPALLARRGNTPDGILAELDKLAASDENRFTGSADWIHNNFVGCLLQLYDSIGRDCPFYSGFATFCQMAHGNLRHFLELSHLSLQDSVERGADPLAPVSVEAQSSAARRASTELLRVVRTFGPEGNRLHAFVLRLGSLFALSQRRPSQSEPERTHFSILRGERDLTAADEHFLLEATRWSVLFEEVETKKKAADEEPEVTEFVLNPIYAPYFTISYRKRRKLELSADDAACLIRGSYDDVSRLLKRFAKAWQVDIEAEDRSLFSHLDGDKG